jgi:NADH:ubiquinone oxidoreductase subunit F (NADH-binding)
MVSRIEAPVDAYATAMSQRTPYAMLLARARQRWNDLTDGDKPWIRVGYGASGQAAGAKAVHEALREYGPEGKNQVNLSLVGANGLMYLEPIVDVSNPRGSRVIHGEVTPEMVPQIIAHYVEARDDNPLHGSARAYVGHSDPYVSHLPNWNDLPANVNQTKILTANFGEIDPLDVFQYIARGGYTALNKAVLSMTPQEVLEEVKKSGLRGRGGAAFPTGLKWSFLAPSEAPVKYVLCNCEEGDPGAFNDKGILESDPHRLIEGLIINGYATNSTHGVVFIRQGHEIPIEATRHAIDEAYENGLLGENILGSDFSFEMEVSLTGDSYVAGEETAMMEAIEGKRSTPRYKPPFPAQAGLFQKPTNINNVKTIAYVPTIVEHGGEEFKRVGTESSSGTALVCLTGHIKRPGMYEVAMGLTIRQVLEDIGGGVADGSERIKVLQTGGPLGGVMGEGAFDTEIDFDAMAESGAILGSGGIIVGDETTDVVDLIRNLVAFNQFESCGKCFPCRLGNTHMLDVLDRMCKNEAKPGDMQLLETVGNNMKIGSLCGHGQLGYNPISSAINYFGEEFEKRFNGELEKSGPFGDGSMILPSRTRP